MAEDNYHIKLKIKMNTYVHNVYKVTKIFPKEEIYGVTNQLRRSALSVILNYIEGFARNSRKVNKSFLKISYASLKESEYLVQFSFDIGYLKENNYKILKKQADEIGAMLWKTMANK